MTDTLGVGTEGDADGEAELHEQRRDPCSGARLENSRALGHRALGQEAEADRLAVTKAAKEAAAFSRQEIRANDDRQLKEMADKGAKIAKPNLEPFRQAVQPAYAKAREKFGAENVNAILKDAEAVRKALPVK